MLPRLTLLSLVLLFIVSGCASISKKECANANWEAMGYRDGSQGKSAGRFDSYQKACVKHGFSADFTRYMDGHNRGLEEVYCKPRKGYQLGLRGAGYNNVCPSDLESAFLPAYYYGRDIYKMEKSYNILNQQIVNLNNRMATLDKRIAELRQISRNDALADHPKGADELRNERTQTAALYSRIKNMRHRGRQSNAFEDHLRHELAAQNQRSDRCVANLVRLSDLSAVERRAIRRIARLSVEKGHLKSQINWANSDPAYARSYLNKRSTLKQQLRELSLEINKLKRELYRHPFSMQEKRHFAHSYDQADYAGALQHHLEALSYHQRSRYAWSSLIDLHFDAEMENLNRRIDFARNHIPSREARAARQERQRELQDALRQRSDQRGEYQGMEQKLGRMKQDIEKLKSESRY